VCPRRNAALISGHTNLILLINLAGSSSRSVFSLPMPLSFIAPHIEGREKGVP
jgi:hypothetical protein